MFIRLYVSMIVTLGAATDALAQATSPATPGAPATPAATNGGGLSWLWIIIGLAIIAGLVWYFMRGRSRNTTATSSTPGATTGRANLYDDDKRK